MGRCKFAGATVRGYQSSNLLLHWSNYIATLLQIRLQTISAVISGDTRQTRIFRAQPVLIGAILHYINLVHA